MMMQIKKPLQLAISFMAIGTSLALPQVVNASVKTTENMIGDIAPKLERDLFEQGKNIKLPLLLANTDAHPTIDPHVQKRFFCKKINQQSVVWNNDATQATLSTIDVLPPSDWTKWGDPNMYSLQDEYRANCRAANPYNEQGQLTGPPNFLHIQTKTRVH